MINIGDVGEDYEHGQQLLKKLSEFRGSGSGVSLVFRKYEPYKEKLHTDLTTYCRFCVM